MGVRISNFYLFWGSTLTSSTLHAHMLLAPARTVASLLDDAKTQVPSVSVYLLFLFKCGDDCASRLCANVRKEFTVLLDVSYYSNVGHYMEVKYRIYASELRMEFYFQLLQIFCRAGETIIGIHCGGKFMLAAKVCCWN